MPQADATRVRRVFELELGRGCQNQVVIGGLDRMLIQMGEDGLLASGPLASRVAALPATGYRSLQEDARREWVQATIRALTPTAVAPPELTVPLDRREPAQDVRTPESLRAIPDTLLAAVPRASKPRQPVASGTSGA